LRKVVLIVAHDSREKPAQQEFKKLVQKYRKRHPAWKIVHAFLELAEPSIPQALESLAAEKEILVLPLFLFTAKHVRKHIPEILKTFRRNHPGAKVRLAQPLGSDSKLLVSSTNGRLKKFSPLFPKRATASCR
jgi:sirohydrochlorin ferrochelatase